MKNFYAGENFDDDESGNPLYIVHVFGTKAERTEAIEEEFSVLVPLAAKDAIRAAERSSYLILHGNNASVPRCSMSRLNWTFDRYLGNDEGTQYRLYVC